MLFKHIASLIFSLIKIIFLFNATSNVKGNKQEVSEKSQNGTFAGRIIEELLKNYEVLKSMYKSQEMLHTSSSFEVNGTSQPEETTKHRNRSFKKKLNNNQTTLHPGTAMIYGSASSHEDLSSSVEKMNDKAIKIDNNKTKKKEKFVNILEHNKKEESEVKESKESESNDGVEEISLEMPTTKDRHDKLKKNVRNEKNVKKVEKPRKKHKSKHNDFGEKTRFDVLKKNTHKKRKQKNLRTEDDPDARRIKKVVYSELFSPFNIWYEVINKPIKLKIDTDPFSKNQKAQNEKQDAKEKAPVDILRELREEDTNSESKKQKMDDILRSKHTYGEACLKIPIKKCKKAIKALTKDVCKKRFKCKSDFRSDLMAFGDTGCLREFSLTKTHGRGEESKKPDEEKIQPLRTRNGNNTIEAKSDENLRDEDFQKSGEKNRHNITVGKSALRDKYEKECLKQSNYKCIAACKYAVQKTCSKNKCESKKERVLTKGCKMECTKLFKIKRNSDDTDSTASGSDSDSESASD